MGEGDSELYYSECRLKWGRSKEASGLRRDERLNVIGSIMEVIWWLYECMKWGWRAHTCLLCPRHGSAKGVFVKCILPNANSLQIRSSFNLLQTVKHLIHSVADEQGSHFTLSALDNKEKPLNRHTLITSLSCSPQVLFISNFEFLSHFHCQRIFFFPS